MVTPTRPRRDTDASTSGRRPARAERLPNRSGTTTATSRTPAPAAGTDSVRLRPVDRRVDAPSRRPEPMTSIGCPRRAPSARAGLELVIAAAEGRVRDLGAALTAFWVIVIVTAGGSSIALLGRPAHSGSYFSWDLGAATAAATIGGLYLASVATFGAALVGSRSQVRSLSVGVLALALPTLWFTLIHRSVFDWTRPQAVAWVILFLAAPLAIVADLRTPAGPDDSPAAGRGTRSTLGVVALAGAVGAGALWVEPAVSRVATHSPIPIVGLTGRYLGAWCAFLATTAAAAAVRGRMADARLTAVLLGATSIGLLAAAARTTDELGPNADAYVAAVATIGIVATVLHRTNRRTDGPAVAALNRSRSQPDERTGS